MAVLVINERFYVPLVQLLFKPSTVFASPPKRGHVANAEILSCQLQVTNEGTPADDQFSFVP
jgi:hypothetical protein